jgi:hypothetical protein
MTYDGLGDGVDPRTIDMPTDSKSIAITLHRIPRKEVCGVVVLEQQEDASWTGKCSKCGGEFRLERDQKFETQVRAMRN